ncbi:hypothetical protein D3C86_1519900 [compost metagenome]
MGGDHIKEAGNLFLCRFATQRQHPVTRLVQFLQGLVVKLAFHVRHFGHHAVDNAARKETNLHIGCGFRRHLAFRQERTAEEIRCELQADDLLTAIRHHFRQLHHALQDIAIGGDEFALAEKLVAGFQLFAAGMAVEIAELLWCQRAAKTAVTRLAGAANNGLFRIVDGLLQRVHKPFPMLAFRDDCDRGYQIRSL